MARKHNTFEDTDWRGEWIGLQEGRDAPGEPSKWDARASSFAQRTVSSYSKTFVEYLDPQDGETVLDMGCGTGELALQIAARGCDVVAADFSTQMLSYLQAAIAREGEQRVRPVRMSWTDDWQAYGVGSKSVDVAIASRSIMVTDLGEALDKLSDVACRKVAITLAANGSPAEDLRVLEAIGRQTHSRYDTVYCINMLFQMGYTPEVRYIDSDKPYAFTSVEDAHAQILKHITNPSPREVELACEFVDYHLVRNTDSDSDAPFTLDYQRFSKWAFISWDVRA